MGVGLAIRVSLQVSTLDVLLCCAAAMSAFCDKDAITSHSSTPMIGRQPPIGRLTGLLRSKRSKRLRTPTGTQYAGFDGQEQTPHPWRFGDGMQCDSAPGLRIP